MAQAVSQPHPHLSARTLRAWMAVHKWTGLVSTLFLLMLCLTGLPLIFHDEIEALSGELTEAAIPGPASAREGLPLDGIVRQAVALNGGGVPLFIGFSQESPLITVTVGPAPDAPAGAMRLYSFNRQTGADLGEVVEEGVMHVLLQLHVDMFLGPWGMYFLGLMGLAFAAAIVSGVVLYLPFMRHLAFGTLRLEASPRVRWLDWHNLAGIVTLGWALVVGLTGVINAFGDPLTDHWREGELARMVAARAGDPPLDSARYGSIDAAMAAAQAAAPGLSPQFIAFPGGAWSSPRHHAIFFQGGTPLTSHILTPALVDAETGELTDMRRMPALNQALMLSKPLHFGDYGGIGLKILWALLDIATIWVLASGLVLWWQRRNRLGFAAQGAPA